MASQEVSLQCLFQLLPSCQGSLGISGGLSISCLSISRLSISSLFISCLSISSLYLLSGQRKRSLVIATTLFCKAIIKVSFECHRALLRLSVGLFCTTMINSTDPRMKPMDTMTHSLALLAGIASQIPVTPHSSHTTPIPSASRQPSAVTRSRSEVLGSSSTTSTAAAGSSSLRECCQ